MQVDTRYSDGTLIVQPTGDWTIDPRGGRGV